ncbi:ATP-dependent nuclease [Oligella ureolytica]|uniref:ATP-dependent nuclease n=1 Tax=Oligella ureolytica TaxID=90244 RepID=UPI001C689BA2|nr:ATP-binding protein [Oligella ureolytica]
MREIKELINNISKMKESNIFDKYITQAKFPNFKSLAPGSIINFNFPLTVLVGVNGTGKSSILHALWGMPYRKSTSRFWFSTEIDPIKESGGELGNIRYIYEYYAKDINQYLQVRKIRTKQQLGYFEPTKPAVTDGMKPMPAWEEKHKAYRTDRWTPVKRDVIYINSKCEIGVAERYFYYLDDGQLTTRLDNFAYESSRLKKVIDLEKKSSKPGGSEYVFANYLITDEALKHINKILNQNYIKARYLLHRYYDRSKAPSVIFKSKDREYSDTFAGSGELSVVTTVLKILDTKEYDLVLLDEPETSLHPQAQVNLIRFLLEQIKVKKLQVVVSTHSPTIVSVLPKEAIKLLEINGSGNSIISEDIEQSIAFHRIGHIDYKKITIISEDQLLHEFIKFCLKQLDPGIQSKFSLNVDSVGVDEVFKHHIPSWINSGHNIYFVADGDQQQKLERLPDVSNLTEKDKNEIEQTLKNISFRPAGLRTPEELINYVKWIKERVKLINAECPEYIFLKTYGKNLADNVTPKNNQAYKERLSEHLYELGYDESITADKMNVVFETQLILSLRDSKNLITTHVEYTKNMLMGIVEKHRS